MPDGTLELYNQRLVNLENERNDRAAYCELKIMNFYYFLTSINQHDYAKWSVLS